MNGRHLPTIKSAHHMWSAERDESGKMRVKRDRQEPEVFACEEDRQAAKEVCAAVWGLWGASLVDDTFMSEIPQGVVARLNEVKGEKLARVYSWQELHAAFGAKVAEVKQSIADGMRVRIASQYLNVPFLVAVELIDTFGEVDGLETVVAAVKEKDSRTLNKIGKSAALVAKIYNNYEAKPRKLAIDDKAKKYYEDYYGPFGKELTREIKRRVRADLAAEWLRKNGVDQKAVEYWSTYFSNGYGADMVQSLASKLSPR